MLTVASGERKAAQYLAEGPVDAFVDCGTCQGLEMPTFSVENSI